MVWRFVVGVFYRVYGCELEHFRLYRVWRICGSSQSRDCNVGFHILVALGLKPKHPKPPTKHIVVQGVE